MKSSTARRKAYGSACLAVLLSLTVGGSALAAKPVKKSSASGKKAAAATVVKAQPTAINPAALAILSRRTIENASAYRAYMDRAAQISAGFTTGKQVEDSLMLGAQSEPQQLSQGVIAYAAVLALQDPSFVAGVRSAATDEGAREALVRRIIENPNVATSLPGASSAGAAIAAALGADGSKVAGAGALVKQAAYDVQRSAWSKATVPAREARLAKAKSYALQSMPAPETEIARITTAIAAVAGSTPAAVTSDAMPAPTTPTVSRGLAIAALAALGAGGESNDAVVMSLMNDPNAGFCMNMSRLNLNQCLSVAKPYYEDVFCLGQHILIDIGQCVSKGAGPQSFPAASLAAGAGAATSAPTAYAASATPAVSASR